MSDTTLNLALARELMSEFLEGCFWRFETANAHIYPLLDGGGEFQSDCLPGEEIAAIAAALEQAIRLASEPAQMPTGGRDRVGKQWAANRERGRIALYARAALALIGGRHD